MPVAGAESSELTLIDARAVELLDAVISEIRDKDITADVNCYSVGIPELPVAGAGSPELTLIITCSVELLYAVISGIRHEDIAADVNCYSGGR